MRAAARAAGSDPGCRGDRLAGLAGGPGGHVLPPAEVLGPLRRPPSALDSALRVWRAAPGRPPGRSHGSRKRAETPARRGGGGGEEAGGARNGQFLTAGMAARILGTAAEEAVCKSFLKYLTTSSASWRPAGPTSHVTPWRPWPFRPTVLVC